MTGAAASPFVRPSRRWQLFEFLAVFVVAPALYTWIGTARVSPIPMLWILAAGAWLLLRRDPTFDRSTLWNPGGARRATRAMMPTFLFATVLIGVSVYLLRPDLFLSFPRERPWIWLLVMVGYPLASVYPQEIFWRAFFFHRYQELFVSERGLIVASALAFGYVHIAFGHALSVGLTVLGGWLFARTYVRSRSLLAACLEHALYGCLMFTIGLGQFFYNGDKIRPQAAPAETLHTAPSPMTRPTPQ